MSWSSDQVPFDGWRLQPAHNSFGDDHTSLLLEPRPKAVDATDYATNLANLCGYSDLDRSVYDTATSLQNPTINANATADTWRYPTTYLHGQRVAPLSANEHDVGWAPDPYDDFGLPVNTMHDSSSPFGKSDYSVTADVSTLLPSGAHPSAAGPADQIIGESSVTRSPRSLLERVDAVSDPNEVLSQNHERLEVDVESATGEHGHVRETSTKICDECGESYPSHAHLARHALADKHSPYRCKCSMLFSRFDVLERHLKKYQVGGSRYPCHHCKLHRGQSSFRRKEHLTQHLRGYHNMEVAQKENSWEIRYFLCPHTDCSWHRGPAFEHLGHLGIENTGPFRSVSKYTQHMREVHDESPYPCAVPYCSKTGGKGYFRELDLKKHYQKIHPEAAISIGATAKRSEVYPCLMLGCSRNGENGCRDGYLELKNHYMEAHGYTEDMAFSLPYFHTSYTIKKT